MAGDQMHSPVFEIGRCPFQIFASFESHGDYNTNLSFRLVVPLPNKEEEEEGEGQQRELLPSGGRWAVRYNYSFYKGLRFNQFEICNKQMHKKIFLSIPKSVALICSRKKNCNLKFKCVAKYLKKIHPTTERLQTHTNLASILLHLILVISILLTMAI
jgi:hypothetical protein